MERPFLHHMIDLVSTIKRNPATVTLLVLIGLIPFVGQLYVLGFVLEWSSGVAWGSDKAIKLSDVPFKTVILNMIRALGIMILFGLSITFVGLIIGLLSIPLFFIMPIIHLIIVIAAVFFGLAFELLIVRATIYKNWSAGLSIAIMARWIKRNIREYLRFWCSHALVTLVVAAVIGVLTLFITIPATVSFFRQLNHLNSYIQYYGYMNVSDTYVLDVLFHILVDYTAAISVATIPISIITTITGTLLAGLLLRDTHPSTWDKHFEEMPDCRVLDGNVSETVPSASDTSNATSATTQPEQMSADQYDKQDQPPTAYQSASSAVSEQRTTPIVPPAYAPADKLVVDEAVDKQVTAFDQGGGASAPKEEQCIHHHAHDKHTDTCDHHPNKRNPLEDAADTLQ